LIYDGAICRDASTDSPVGRRWFRGQLCERLTTRYADLPPDQVAGAVHSAHARFEQCPIREFVPLLVERRARAELSRNTGLLTLSS
jgi:hypothetical protein